MVASVDAEEDEMGFECACRGMGRERPSEDVEVVDACWLDRIG